MSDSLPRPTFREATRFWFKLGCISFGGPAGQIAIMQTELVERRRWIENDRFMHALNFCMLLPGPEAQQLATYCGWLLHRTWGGIVAGALFVLPSAVLLWALSVIYVTYGQVSLVAGVFDGLKPAVLAIVVAALIRIGRKSLRTPFLGAIAAGAFVAIFFVGAPFPLIVFGAGLLGWTLATYRPDWLGMAPPHVVASAEAPRPSWAHATRVLAVGLPLWAAPIVLTVLIFGPGNTFTAIGLFFSKAAMVTFGGAYAVLPYVAQQAVERHAWLAAPQMLDGLAFAETTPGPLVMVLQFVGFMGGWNHPESLSPLAAATLGAGLTTWTTFVPCFIWIFLGAPYVEHLRGHRRVDGALRTVTGAVVGVMLNLAVWFALPVLGLKDGNVDLLAIAILIAAFMALHRFKVNLLWVIAGAGAVGLLEAFMR